MKNDILGYAPPIKRPPSPLWAFTAMLVGAFGAPAALICSPLFPGSYHYPLLGSVPLVIIPVGAIIYVFAARKKFLVSDNPPKRSLMAIVGSFLVLLWAPLFLVVLATVALRILFTGKV